MSKEVLEFDGEVIENSKDRFIVQVNENYNVKCTLSGKIRQNAVRILVGDRVKIEVSIYDTNQGRIVYRHKN